ncbi:MAG: DUF6457 domain-containing protein [Nocardioides marinisabuli]|uniref:DUF6457 domain-containing protein n=1 Tax=Nocardioides marinisabuli TaxID=419476 RepID=UPI00321ADDFE
MNLHDWIDELCDALDLDAEVDETLLLDLARDVAHAVTRPAAPLSAYLLGLAAGAKGGDPAVVEELAERVRALADGWDQPATAAADNIDGTDDAEDELDGAADPLTEIEDLDDLLGRDPEPDAGTGSGAGAGEEE